MMKRRLFQAMVMLLSVGICTSSFGQIVRLPPGGTFVFTASAASVNENAGFVPVTVARTGGARGTVTVNLATTPGTAIDGRDYRGASGTLKFFDGDATPRTLKIPIIADQIRERPETFTVTLSNPTGGAVLGTPHTETITILDGTTGLALTSSVPANGSTGVDRSTTVQLNFSASIDASTAPGNIRLLAMPGGTVVTTLLSVSAAQVTLTPQTRLGPLSQYSVQIDTGLRGVNGEQLAAATSVSFTTRDRGWLGAQLVETEDLGNASAWSIAFDSAGNGWATWVQFNGARDSVRVSRYVPGSGWQNPATTIESNPGDANNPQLAIDPSGNVMVIWNQKSSSLISDMWANRYTAGSGWGTPTLIEAGAGSELGVPRIAMDAAGNAIAVWPQSGASPSTQDIWANRYVSGGSWGTATLIGPTGAGTSFEPEIGVDDIGNAVVTWRQPQVPAGIFSIWSNRYTVGAGWSGPELIESNPNTTFFPVVAVDGPGNALALWEQQDSTGHVVDLGFNRFIPGSGWGASAAFGAVSPPLDERVSLNAAGNGFVVWRQDNTGSTDTIWARPYSASGSWGSFSLIDTPLAGNSQMPTIAVDPAGNAFAAWIRADGTNYNVWANHYTTTGGWGTPELIDSQPLDASAPRVAVDAAGNALVIWTQNDGTRYNIWSNRFE
jgi:hypothetical protein